MTDFDPLQTLARPDLTAASLEGIVAAERYAPTRAMRVAVPVAPMFAAPNAAGERVDEMLYGERFDVLETRGGLAWGQAARDGCVGFVAADALAPGGPLPTHRVAALSTGGFDAPSIKAAVPGSFGLNALVAVGVEAGDFSRAADGRWFRSADLAPIGVFERDPAAVAEWFLGAPYRSGGRTFAGIDGAGLIQQALYACGRACPHGADQQLAIGRPVTRAEARRGDLVGWPGHVGLLVDEAQLIHADARHGAVAIEPLEEAIARIGASPVFRRL